VKLRIKEESRDVLDLSDGMSDAVLFSASFSNPGEQTTGLDGLWTRIIYPVLLFNDSFSY